MLSLRVTSRFALITVVLLTAGFASAQSISTIPIGSSYNVYSILLDEQNQVAYNPELDAVTFAHRQDNGTPGGSGGMAFNRSLDGGATWSSQFITSPAYNSGATSEPVIGNRYPNITIYNPAGNTDPANAFAVLTGPTLFNTGTAGAWGYIFQQSAKLTDGSAICEEYYTNTPSDPQDFQPYSLVTNANGEMWSISTQYTNFADQYDSYRLNKGVFNATTNCVDWSVAHTITPNYSLDGAGDEIKGYGWSIGFSPDGNAGYAVHLSGEPTNSFCGIQPIVHKTMDAGVSWTRLPDFDFRTLPAFTDNLRPASCGDQIPFMTSVDIVVDNSGALQMVGEVLPRSSCSCDSIYFIWREPSVYSLSTTNGTSWDATLIDSILTSFDGSVGGVGVGTRAQIARTADGSKLMYSWSKSDAALVSSNDLPNLWIRGLDVASNSLSARVNVTGGTTIDGGIYFPTIAPTIMETGASKDYELAVVYADPSASAIDPADYFFIRGVGLDEADFNSASCATAPVLSPASLTGGILQLNWTPVTGSSACKVRYGKAAGSFSHWELISGLEVSSASVPLIAINPGDYKAKIRCACPGPGLVTAPVSNTVFFTAPPTPTARTSGELQISPNPIISGFLQISLQDIEIGNEVAVLQLASLDGRIVLKQNLQSQDLSQTSVDITDFPVGIYLLSLQTADELFTSKVFIEK